MRCSLMVMLLMGIAILALPAQGQGIDSFFDVFTEVTMGPPYPTPPVDVQVSHQAGPAMVSTQILGIGLQGVDNNSPARIAASDSGGGGGGGAGVQSFFDVFTELSVGDYPVDSFFDVFFEFEAPSLDKATPVILATTGYHIDSFFDVFTELSVDGGQESLHIHGQIGPGQPLMFSDVETRGTFDSWFDVWAFCQRTGGPILPSVPLFTMTVTGTFVPEPASLVSLLICGLMMAGQRRRPE